MPRLERAYSPLIFDGSETRAMLWAAVERGVASSEQQRRGVWVMGDGRLCILKKRAGGGGVVSSKKPDGVTVRL